MKTDKNLFVFLLISNIFKNYCNNFLMNTVKFLLRAFCNFPKKMATFAYKMKINEDGRNF
jgi:hypothetical protein